jgi:hypothetical protein
VFDSKWCVCVERSTTHAYIVDEGRFSAGIFGSHRKPSLHGGMQSPKKHGPERRQEGAATPRVRPHPGGPLRHHLLLVSCLVGLGPSCGGVSTQLLREGGLLHFSLFAHFWNTHCASRFVLYFVHFHLFLGICLQNMFSRNTSGTRQ